MLRSRLVILVFSVLIPAVLQAQEQVSPVVIKATPTLVYFDAGSQQGTRLGEAFVILRRQENGAWTHVADVRVIRLQEAFSIAEILFVAAGEKVAVPQQVMPLVQWEQQAEYVQRAGGQPLGSGNGVRGQRFLFVLGGGEWYREADDLQWRAGNLMGVSRSHGVGLGVRLGSAVAPRWRLNMTYRVGLGSDVTALSVESDLQFLPGGSDHAGPYAGAGAGLHYLTWDVPAHERNAAMKLGANFMVGMQFPGRYDVIVETGYQRVMRWDDLVDMSHLRTYVGVGRAF